MISRIQNILLNDDSIFWNEKLASILSKSLYLFLILKIAFLWPNLNDIITNSPFKLGSGIKNLVFAPLILININFQIFLICFLGVLVLSLAIKPNYFCAAIIFWLSISLSKLIGPVTNGSDLVLNIFLFINIFLSTIPKLLSIKGSQLQVLISSAALLLGQVQIALIYFLSGYDKLTSTEWQTGAAMNSIVNLTFFQNPFLQLELNELQCIVLCWMIIVFELSFSILIWFRKFRILFLIMGTLFHMGIVFFLGLADFGIVMIICYAVYLPIKTNTSKKLGSVAT